MTYLNNESLSLMFDKHETESRADKYFILNGGYVTLFINHWDLLDDVQKKKVCQYCIDMTMSIKGGDTKNSDLWEVKQIMHLPNFPKIHSHLAVYIEQLPVKNGNQVIQRYIQSKIWNTGLNNPHFDKINDKTNIAVRGWILAEYFSDISAKNELGIWHAKRLLLSHRKNTAKENIMAVRTLDISLLDDNEKQRYWNTIKHLFTSQSTEVSIDDVVEINNIVGRYLDTCIDIKEIECYPGIPDYFLPALPIDNDYVKKYALNAFFPHQHMYYKKGCDITSLDFSLFKNTRLYQERTDNIEKQWKLNTLKWLMSNHITVIDDFFFHQSPMGFKVLFVLLILLHMMQEELNTDNAIVMKQLKEVGDFLHLDTKPIINAFIKGENIVEITNKIFKDFLISCLDTIKTLGPLISNMELSLKGDKYHLNFEKAEFEKNKTVTSYNGNNNNYEGLLTLFEQVLREMGSDMGYTEEEIELLF